MTAHTSSDAQPGFRERAIQVLASPDLQENFHDAMAFLRQKRASAFADEEHFQRLQAESQRIKQEALSQLPDLLETLEARCTVNGIQVHWAETGAEACDLIRQIIEAHVPHREGQPIRVIKGKSMATEEIGLNTHLEQHGMHCLESDMGEFIVQLAKQSPSHIIMPAIHLRKQEIARLFSEKLPDTPYTEDVDRLIGIGRQVLREQFEKADVGISGVNFAIADTGTLCLLENEGNGRLSTTAPDLHIAVCGIEKVIPRLSDLPPLLSVLTRSATGQAITTYVNLISSPRRLDEKDGPSAVHLVLLDNGRSRMFQDAELQATLRCIRCGACMNHCPVYAKIGGHAYGSVYPGPIGQVIMPQIEGIRAHGEMTEACSLNGACGEVCPVGIPLPDLIREQRERRAQLPEYSRGKEAWIWRLWVLGYRHPQLYRIWSRVVTQLRRLSPRRLRPWSPSRAVPRPARQTLHERMKAHAAQMNTSGKHSR
ncbi:MAG: lactate utilization protein [Hahellaceae bacterium]|jgi:L-lactate dehydrogenase complex protein LldF|nr:lactate utilization protein [Hahellaceae bacterium]